MLKNIIPVYNREYEQINLGDFIIHAIPHCATEKDMEENVAKANIVKGKKNILMTHAGIVESQYKTGEFNEQKIPQNVLKNHNYDYIALGHYHSYSHVGKNAYYSGSTERLGIKYAGKTMGILEVPIDSLKPNLIPLNLRPMVDLDAIDAKDMSINQVLENIYSQKNKVEEGAVVRAKVINLQRNVYVQMDRNEIENQFTNAFHFELECELASTHRYSAMNTTLDDLETEFQRYIDSRYEQQGEKVALTNLAREYLEKAKSAQTYDN